MAHCRFDQAVSALDAALHVHEWEMRDIEGALRVRLILGLVHKRRGKWAVAEDVMERSVALAEEHALLDRKWKVLANLGVLRLKMGKCRAALDALKAIVSECADHQATSNARLTLAIHDRMCGRYVQARNETRAVRAWARETGYARTEILCDEYLGDVRFDQGYPEHALKSFDRALQLSRAKFPDTDMVCEAQRRRAEALVQLGRVTEAREAAEEALRISTTIGEPYEVALAHRALGLVCEAEGNATAFRTELKSCEEILRQLGEKFELGRTLLHQARLAMRGNAFSAGAELIEEARRIFTDMEMDHWVAIANDALLSRPGQGPGGDVTAAGSTGASGALPGSRPGEPPARFGIITQDQQLIGMFADLSRVAQSKLPVILEGESGTGKELFARALHLMSDRRKRSFVPVNCGAIPREMQEAELFGHRRGAFTGALDDNPGLFETADNGTLFLDEIGEMSPSAQVKLLRAIETGEIRRVGERHHREVDVRYVAATNSDLEKAISSGRFREDLFYRLDGLRLRIPPLRERRGDIPPLLEFFMAGACARAGKRVSTGKNLLNHLLAYDWPGNVRELRNKVERAVMLAEPDSELTLAHFSFPGEGVIPGPKRTLDEDLEDVERQRILRALHDSRWVKAVAARQLNITRTTLASRMERLGIPLKPPGRLRPPR